MDVDGTRERLLIEPLERVIGQKEAAISADLEELQALTARTISCRDVLMHRMTVPW
jgi:hypothetical protein